MEKDEKKLQMHIGLDGLPLTTPKTGVGHYTYELGCALAEIEPSSQFEFVYPSTYPPIDLIEHDAGRPSNLKINRVDVGPIGRHWWSVGLPRYISGMRHRGQFDLFHGTNYDVPLWRRCASVLTIHDLSHLVHPQTHKKRSVRRARRRLPLMVRNADAIITPTESVRREVCGNLRIGAEKVFAIPEAARACFRPLAFAETADARRRLGIGDDFLLTVGTLEPRKNLCLLVGAFEQITRERLRPNTQLVIAGGRGWLSGALFATIKKSPARDRILLTDYLHDQDLRALYASCRAFIYPSIYEGFGLPPLEAMACGAPVIASRIPALTEIVGNASTFFDPNSVDELTERILELLDHEHGESIRQAIITAGLQRAAEFSWEKTARETLQVYVQAVKRFGNGRG